MTLYFHLLENIPVNTKCSTVGILRVFPCLRGGWTFVPLQKLRPLALRNFSVFCKLVQGSLTKGVVVASGPPFSALPYVPTHKFLGKEQNFLLRLRKFYLHFFYPTSGFRPPRLRPKKFLTKPQKYSFSGRKSHFFYFGHHTHRYQPIFRTSGQKQHIKKNKVYNPPSGQPQAGPTQGDFTQ